MTEIRGFQIPTVMKHGLGATSALADEAKALGMKRPLIVSGDRMWLGWSAQTRADLGVG